MGQTTDNDLILNNPADDTLAIEHSTADDIALEQTTDDGIALEQATEDGIALEQTTHVALEQTTKDDIVFGLTSKHDVALEHTSKYDIAMDQTSEVDLDMDNVSGDTLGIEHLADDDTALECPIDDIVECPTEDDIALEHTTEDDIALDHTTEDVFTMDKIIVNDGVQTKADVDHDMRNLHIPHNASERIFQLLEEAKRELHSSTDAVRLKSSRTLRLKKENTELKGRAKSLLSVIKHMERRICLIETPNEEETEIKNICQNIKKRKIKVKHSENDITLIADRNNRVVVKYIRQLLPECTIYEEKEVYDTSLLLTYAETTDMTGLSIIIIGTHDVKMKRGTQAIHNMIKLSSVVDLDTTIVCQIPPIESDADSNLYRDRLNAAISTTYPNNVKLKKLDKEHQKGPVVLANGHQLNDLAVKMLAEAIAHKTKKCLNKTKRTRSLRTVDHTTREKVLVPVSVIRYVVGKLGKTIIDIKYRNEVQIITGSTLESGETVLTITGRRDQVESAKSEINGIVLRNISLQKRYNPYKYNQKVYRSPDRSNYHRISGTPNHSYKRRRSISNDRSNSRGRSRSYDRTNRYRKSRSSDRSNRYRRSVHSNNHRRSKSSRYSRSRSYDRSHSCGRSRSYNRSHSRGRSRSYSRSHSRGRSESFDRSKSRKRSRSVDRSNSRSRSRSSDRSCSRGRSRSFNRSSSHKICRSSNRSNSRGRSRYSGRSDSRSRSRSFEHSNKYRSSSDRTHSGCELVQKKVRSMISQIN